MKKLIVMATVGLLIMASTAFAKEVDQSKKAGQSEKAYNCTDTSGISKKASEQVAIQKLNKVYDNAGIRTSKGGKK